jgi:hypothetical protein
MAFFGACDFGFLKGVKWAGFLEIRENIKIGENRAKNQFKQFCKIILLIGRALKKINK